MLRLQLRPRNSSDLSGSSGKNLTAGSNVLGLIITSRKSDTQIFAQERTSQHVNLEQPLAHHNGQLDEGWLWGKSRRSSYCGYAFLLFFNPRSLRRQKHRELIVSRTWTFKNLWAAMYPTSIIWLGSTSQPTSLPTFKVISLRDVQETNEISNAMELESPICFYSDGIVLMFCLSSSEFFLWPRVSDHLLEYCSSVVYWSLAFLHES